MGRAPCCDKANVKRGPWSPEEDTALKNYLHRHGTGGNWIALPHKAGLKRCGKSCRLRWLNYLRPDIKHGGFTEEEDNIICTLYKNIGSRWSVIASHLPGRTDNDVKNYWNTKLKKKLLAAKTNPSNNLTTNSNSPIKISSSPSSSHVSVPKTETLCYSFSTLSSEISSLLLPPLESGFDFTMSSLQKLLQEPIQFPPQTSIDVFSSQMDSSVSNSNVSFSSPLPQGSSFNAEFESCLMDFNHGSAAEAFGEYGFSDKIGEAPAGFANFGFPNLFAAGDNKQQGIYQSVTY